MVSDTDLPHQPDTLQQVPVMKKNKSHKWKYFFIILTIINVIGFGFFLSQLLYLLYPTPCYPACGYNGLGAVIILVLVILPLACINIVSTLIYLAYQHPQGKSKIISYTVLIIMAPILIYLGLFLGSQILH